MHTQHTLHTHYTHTHTAHMCAHIHILTHMCTHTTHPCAHTMHTQHALIHAHTNTHLYTYTHKHTTHGQTHHTPVILRRLQSIWQTVSELPYAVILKVGVAKIINIISVTTQTFFPFAGAETDMSKPSTEALKSYIYSADMDSSRFMELATLCSDHSLLGYQLLSMAKEPLKDFGAQCEWMTILLWRGGKRRIVPLSSPCPSLLLLPPLPPPPPPSSSSSLLLAVPYVMCCCVRVVYA